jgi:tetrahydromethanopterin S-methyltransferase subunit A
MNKIAIAGRLLTENKGIDEIILYVNQHSNIKRIILCGYDVWGHKAGHSLLQLHKNGIDHNSRIIGSKSPDPILTVKKSEVNYFQQEVKLINLIDEINLKKISYFV